MCSPAQPLSTAMTWSAFLLDGMLSTVDEPYCHRITLLSPWPHGMDQLIAFHTQVLLALYTQMQPYWHHPLLEQHNVFEYLVVNALGDALGRDVLALQGQYPSTEQYQQRIQQALRVFFSPTA